MKFLNDISKKEKFSQTLIIVSILGCFVFSLLMYFIFMKKSTEITNKAKDEIYVFVDNQAYKAVRSDDYGKSTEAAAKGAVQLFDDFFWNLEPYQDYINDRHNKAFAMSDESTKRLRKSLLNDNFYTDIINSKSSTKIEINPSDISIDFTKKPFAFTSKGKFIINSGKTRTIHNFEASGLLEQTRQVDNNFTGYLIKDYKLNKLEVVQEVNESALAPTTETDNTQKTPTNEN